MTVGAQQNALRNLRPGTLERPRQPALAERERFVGTVHVVELQGTQVAGVAADRTAPARLRDEDLLDPPPASRHRLAVAEPAAVPPDLSCADEHLPTVNAALAKEARRPGCIPPRVAGGLRPHAVLREPVTHGRGTAIQLGGELPDRESSLHERLKLCASDRPARLMPSRVLRQEAVLVDPVGDGRGALPASRAMDS